MIEPDLALARRFVDAQGARVPLIVGVTGAHAYGFPSPDSDLDLKEMVGTIARDAAPRPKDLLYAYRVALTGTHLLRTGRCVLDVRELALEYGFAAVPDLIARKGAGAEHAAGARPDDWAGEAARLQGLLEDAEAASTLPAEPETASALDAFVLRRRRASWTA